MIKLKNRDLQKYKEDLIKAFHLMEIELKKTFHLKKIIEKKWLLKLKSEIDAVSVSKPFSAIMLVNISLIKALSSTTRIFAMPILSAIGAGFVKSKFSVDIAKHFSQNTSIGKK